MDSLIAVLANTENFMSILVGIIVIGFGIFFAKAFWPWLTSRIDKTMDEWMDLKREELVIEADRNQRYASAWRDNNQLLSQNNERMAEMTTTLKSLTENNRAMIGALLSFVDNKKLQDKLYSLFYDEDKPNG